LEILAVDGGNITFYIKRVVNVSSSFRKLERGSSSGVVFENCVESESSKCIDQASGYELLNQPAIQDVWDFSGTLMGRWRNLA
jgi:hypothetical protein